MKNKKFLVIIATVLMACLVVGMGAMTYSRYISTTELPAQSATAAKWGYVITADASNLFGSDYKVAEGTTARVDGTGALVVDGNADAVVVAPGTAGSMTITISGTAEVKSQLTFDFEATSDISYDGYNPVEWTLTKPDGSEVCEGVTIAELETKLNGLSQVIEANGSVAGNYTISWSWAFDNGAENNAKDTLIGYKAQNVEWATIAAVKCATGATYATFTGDTGAKYGDISTVVSFTLSVTVKQIQQ